MQTRRPEAAESFYQPREDFVCWITSKPCASEYSAFFSPPTTPKLRATLIFGDLRSEPLSTSRLYATELSASFHRPFCVAPRGVFQDFQDFCQENLCLPAGPTQLNHLHVYSPPFLGSACLRILLAELPAGPAQPDRLHVCSPPPSHRCSS